jgi:hypothetical protein|tara:strand:+ start:234 stop:479 length:246 start_codon:yes stop_codon:yes gene_type:complete
MTVPNKYDDKITYEEIYERLLDVTKEFSDEGATPFDVAHVMAHFVVELSFDCAPDSSEAVHVLLHAINSRIERDCESDDDN